MIDQHSLGKIIITSYSRWIDIRKGIEPDISAGFSSLLVWI